MRYTLSVVLVCLLILGTTVARANDLEGAAHRLPRLIDDVSATTSDRVPETHVDEWNHQAAGSGICPTIEELNLARQHFAREALNTPNPTEAYKAAMGNYAYKGLACYERLLLSTPHGRAFLARVSALGLRMALHMPENGGWAVYPGSTENRVEPRGAAVSPQAITAMELVLFGGVLQLIGAWIALSLSMGWISSGQGYAAMGAAAAVIGVGVGVVGAAVAVSEVLRERAREPER